ncbi:hypothetical protein SCALM49S_09614 [Streptomyces californicus]
MEPAIALSPPMSEEVGGIGFLRGADVRQGPVGPQQAEVGAEVRTQLGASGVPLAPLYRDLFVNWDSKASDMVSYLRLYAGCHPDDPELSALVGELLRSKAARSSDGCGRRTTSRRRATARSSSGIPWPGT